MFTVKLFSAGVLGSYFSDDIPDLPADNPADGGQFIHDFACADSAWAWRWSGGCLWGHGWPERLWNSRGRRVHEDHDWSGGGVDCDGRLSGHAHAVSGEAGSHNVQQVLGGRERDEGRRGGCQGEGGRRKGEG